MKKNQNKRIEKKKKKNLVMLALFFSLILFLTLYLWIFNYTNILIGSIDKLKREEAYLIAQNKKSRIEKYKLSRADRIKEKAFNEINMVSPKPETLSVIIDHNILEMN